MPVSIDSRFQAKSDFLGVKQENIAVFPEKEHLAYLVHDMRSVATSVSLMVDLLELSASADNHPAQVARAHSAQQSCQQMAQLCAEIASQLNEPEPDESEPQSFDAAGLVDEVQTIYEPIYELARKTLVCETPQDPIEYIGNRQTIFRALSNLLDNGLRHTKNGSIVNVDCSKLVNSLEISVADNGPGIMVPTDGRIWTIEKFVNSSFSNVGRSSVFQPGTGLRFVSKAVAAHTGRSSITRNAMGGTTVTMSFSERQIFDTLE